MLRPLALDEGTAFGTEVEDAHVGRVRLSGMLHLPAEPSDTVVVVLHGIGGDISSHYMCRAAAAATAAGLACLRLNMRGADLSGDDIYHAGLTDDLRAAIASEALAPFERVLLLGYSLGGHLVLRHATEAHDPRIGAVAAICPPIDLDQAARDLDAVARWPYRRYVLRYLKRVVRHNARFRPPPIAIADVMAITRLRDWDEQLVAPRFGFADALDYYRRMSVAPRLGNLDVPALLLATRHDPMIVASSLERALRSVAPQPLLDTRWLDRAGHVGFPADAHLGEPGPSGLEAQALTWLTSNLR
jgi:hypothetical protein